jgi:DNA-binding protein HU-beta
MSKTRIMAVLDTTFNTIGNALKKGDAVRLVGFGSWKRLRRKSRPGRNPQTGKKLTIPARNVAKFSMSEHLYDLLN